MKQRLKNYRYWLVLLSAFLIILSIGSCTQKVEKNVIDVQRAEKSPESPTKPSWLDAYPIVMVGNWDTAPIFRRRKGGNPLWHEDDYRREHSEEAVKKLKEIGVTMAVIHFYKGFGLEAEKEQLEYSKKLASLCKKYGIKVGVYVGSTVAYETFLLEKPEAEEWFVPDYLGQPVTYGGTQVFRKRVYFMHPGYVDYIKSVVKIAIEDLKVDLIHFDNTSLRARAPAFFHPLAVQNFKTFLEKKYTPEMLKKRLGFSSVKYVEPPKYDRPLSTIEDPLFQEWTDFRCRQLADFYGEMERFIHRLNPEVVVENNPHSGISGHNTMWQQGVDYPRLLSHTNIVWTEEGNEAAVSEEGILISKIRTYKMASTLNNKIFTYTGDSELQMAEAMAYNRQCLGMVGGVLAGFELSEKRNNIGFDNPYTWGGYLEGFEFSTTKLNYIKFFHKNFEYYRDIDNIADVAVLHSYSTMAFNNDRPYQSTFLFEQALIQDKIQFDIIFDDNLKDLSKYSVLVLADQECLSDEKLDLIRGFVKSGGGLVATENTSLYTEWRQRRREFGLKDLFQLEPPVWPARSSFSQPVLDIPVVRNQIGNGRVVYISEIKPAIPKPPTAAMVSRYWKLPLNRNELIESVKWAGGNELSIEVNAPLTVTAEITMKMDKSSLMLHLINYDAARSPSVRNVEVSLKIPDGKNVKQLSMLSPDEESGQSLDSYVRDGRAIFTVPRLETYNLIVIELE